MTALLSVLQKEDTPRQSGVPSFCGDPSQHRDLALALKIPKHVGDRLQKIACQHRGRGSERAGRI